MKKSSEKQLKKTTKMEELKKRGFWLRVPGGIPLCFPVLSSFQKKEEDQQPSSSIIK